MEIKMDYNKKFLKFRIAKLIYFFLLIKINTLKIRKGPIESGNKLHKNEEKITVFHRVLPYFSMEATVFEDNKINKISHEKNICAKLVKDHKNFNSPLEKRYKLENREYTIEIRNKENTYHYTNNLLKNLGLELCNKVLIFSIAITNDLCEFDIYNNYTLYINYLKNVQIEHLQTALLHGRFLFLKLPQSFDLNKSIPTFSENEYIIKKGILENDIIKFDFTNIILNQVCNSSSDQIRKPFDENKNSNNNKDNQNKKKIINFVVITSHVLSDIIIFPSTIMNAEYVKNYKNMKNVVKIKKKIVKNFTDWVGWSPCYNICSDNFSYKCRYNNCMNDESAFCDQHLLLDFYECEPKTCKNELNGPNEDGKKEEKPSSSSEQNTTDEDGYLLDDDTMSGKRKHEKTNFFMWIINNKKLSLGLLIFFIVVIILGCLYCYVNSSLGFHNDEEYYVSNYR
ncbi:conserved Plasmodium protein, unknown function [Plasmodium malariae]|nr:conserved Plasmodium protein, unknown function [Plasmodium malariae]SCP03470.1 conserved Plasmodium protein, unknown function [Plasmodium malariae]